MSYKDLEAQRKYQREWLARRRNAWILAHGPCAECGSDVDLEVDHVDPDTKKMNPTSLWSMSETNPKRVAELAKCQVLCKVCHLAKTVREELARYPDLAHGTFRMYKNHGCKCQPCKDSNAERRRKQRGTWREP